jgi:hypothetical protein
LLLLAFTAVVPAFAQSDTTVYSTAQRFERGLMLWRSDTSYIWVLTNSGYVYNFPSSRYSRLPDNPIRGNFPSPINGFGRVWGNFTAVRTAIGLPTLGELGFDMRIVQWNGVYYLQQLDGTIYQINPDGTWVRAPGMPIASPPAAVTRFDVQPLTTSRGGTVTVTWSLMGVNRARLEIWDTGTNALVSTIPALPASGARAITLPSTLIGGAGIIVAGDDNASLLPRAEIVVNFVPAPDHSTITSAAYQQYQNGFMVWRADAGTVFVFSGAGSGFFSSFAQPYLEALGDNPFGAAPPNLVRPINGFGRVWGNLDWVRSTLGWATAPEQAYTTTIVLSQGTPVGFALPNNHYVNLAQNGTWTLT